jgi:hypothetical protein
MACVSAPVASANTGLHCWHRQYAGFLLDTFLQSYHTLRLFTMKALLYTLFSAQHFSYIMLRHHSILLHGSARPHLLLSPCAASKQHLNNDKLRVACAANSQHSSDSSNGSTAPQQQEQEDPVAAMLWAAQQDGVKVAFEEDSDGMEDLEDVMEDLEDPWMRNPSRKCATAAVILGSSELTAPATFAVGLAAVAAAATILRRVTSKLDSDKCLQRQL